MIRPGLLVTVHSEHTWCGRLWPSGTEGVVKNVHLYAPALRIEGNCLVDVESPGLGIRPLHLSEVRVVLEDDADPYEAQAWQVLTPEHLLCGGWSLDVETYVVHCWDHGEVGKVDP